MNKGLELRLLGNPEVFWEGKLITDFPSRKTLALLCYLAVTGRPHSRYSLVGLLWPEMADKAGRRSLSKALSQLNSLKLDKVAVLKPYLVITPETVAFNQELPYGLDVKVFEAKVEHPTEAELKLIEQAIEL